MSFAWIERAGSAPPPAAAVVVRGSTSTDQGEPSGLSVKRSCFATVLLDPTWGHRAINSDAWAQRLGVSVSELKSRFGDGTLPKLAAFPSETHRRVEAGRLTLVIARVGVRGAVSLARYLGSEVMHIEVTPNDFPRHLEVDVDTPLDLAESGLATGVSLLLRSRVKVSRAVLAAADGARLAGDLSGAASRARVLGYYSVSDPGPARILAQCYRARGRIEEAIVEWREAVRRAPENGALRFQYAETLSVAVQPVEATAEYMEAIRLLSEPSDALVTRARGAIAQLEGTRRIEEARRAGWDRAREEAREFRTRPAMEDVRRAEETERLAVLEERVGASPADEMARLELAELLVARRLYVIATRRLREGLLATPESIGIRRALARTLLRDGRFDEASEVLSELNEQEHSAEVWILLGDIAMGRAGGPVALWSDLVGDEVPLSLSHYLRRQPQKSGPAAIHLVDATAAYRRAVELAPNDGRARARLLDARTLNGEAKQIVAALESVGPMPYPDLLRVFACALFKVGERFRGSELFDRFLQRVVTQPERVALVVEGWLRRSARQARGGAGGEIKLLEHAERLLDRGLRSAPSHARLRWLRGRMLLARGRASEALAQLRYAFVAGEETHRKLEALWANPPRGPRTQRPPETPTPAVEAALPGAPRTLSDFLRLRMEIASLLLPIEPFQALTELRHAEYFLKKEEVRLRSSRTQRGESEDVDREWTRPANRRQEPVDFGNVRHRLLWARLRTFIGDGHQALGDYDSAERAYGWSARAVAVRKGSVLLESEWAMELSVAEGRVVRRALLGLAATKTKRGEKDTGKAIRQWAKEFDYGDR